MNAPLLATDALRPAQDEALSVFLIAAEPSGDLLGAGLMTALAKRAGRVRFAGVGGPAMQAQGMRSLLPLGDVAVMGILPVLERLPQLMAAIRSVANAAIAARPDILVIIDSPDLTHRVARRVRRACPDLPIVNYVSPSVWAWRPRRARRMRPYVDHVLALLPFEPAAYARLDGPDCTYVGHPLMDGLAALQPNSEESRLRETSRTLVVMPGSREAEIRRLMPVFGAAIAQLRGPLEIVLPTLPPLESLVRAEARQWALAPRIVTARDDKHAAMRCARAALLASGTATLELALARVPMVVAYRVSRVDEVFARLMLNTDKIALPNLILGRHAVPELLQAGCSAQAVAQALQPLLAGGRARDAQLAAFQDLRSLMDVGGRNPSDKAAAIIERLARELFPTRTHAASRASAGAPRQV